MTPETEKPQFWPLALPILISLLLAMPVFSFPFLWDDFDFLGRTQELEGSELLPDPQTLYYRPISREVYFSLVHLLGSSPLWGHALNAAALAGTIVLLFYTVHTLAGIRAALLASLLFAVFGASPVLTGWVSGSQDVLAMLFIMGAILAQLRGRTALGLPLFACALLSKETAAALLPSILLAAYLNRRRADLRVIAAYGLLTAIWLLIHPAPRLLPSEPSREEALGASTVGPLASVWREFLTVLNVPLGAPDRDFLWSLAPYAGGAAVLLAFGTALLSRPMTLPMLRDRSRVPLVLGLVILIPSSVLAGLLPLVWSPYYACIPAMGLAVFAGPVLARARPQVAGLVLMGYLVLGLLSRAVGLEPIVTSELHLRDTGTALTKVEHGFKAVRSEFPERANVYVSAQLQGPHGIYTHLYRFQPLKIWYDEPSVLVVDPNRPLRRAGEDFLFWITKDYHVFEIDLEDLEPKTSGAPVDVLAYQKTLRTFALGVASLGRTDDAVRILLQMEGRPAEVLAYDRRTAAALLLAADRREDASALLVGVMPFTRVSALEATFAILHEPIPDLALEAAVMEAFGLTPDDLETNRMLMQAFDQEGYSEAAIRFAQRVQRLVPRDEEATRILRKWLERRKPVRISVPIQHSWRD